MLFLIAQVGSVRLLVTPTYAKTATPLEAAATSDMISYKLTVTNTGLLEVFNISVAAWGDGAGIVGPLTCTDVDGSEVIAEADTDGGLFPLTSRGLMVRGLASYPYSGLRGGRSLICAFSSAVGQSEVRNRGNVSSDKKRKTFHGRASSKPASSRL